MKYQIYFSNLANQVTNLETYLAEVYDFWSPDEPPFLTLLADVGRIVAEDTSRIKDNTSFFKVIEDGMLSDDLFLQTAVSTGFLESLISHLELRTGNYNLVAPFLGSESQKYIEAWTTFCMGDPPP